MMSDEPEEKFQDVRDLEFIYERDEAQSYIRQAGWRLLKINTKRNAETGEYSEFVFGWTLRGEPSHPQRSNRS
jgi:hypothetical protein